MVDLDRFLGTPDEHFNLNAQNWYFQFQGYDVNQNVMAFDIFIQAIHDVYFFIMENKNKPVSCIAKINEIEISNNFSNSEKVFFTDKLLGILYHYPDNDKIRLVQLQITNYRNVIQPYMEDPDIINPKWKFNIDEIQLNFENLNSYDEKRKFLINLLLDYTAKANEIDEIEHEYYNSIGFTAWIKTELVRININMQGESSLTVISNFTLSNSITKIDLIRILNAMYELKYIFDMKGQIPTKESFMIKSGEFFGVDLSKYDIDLSQAYNNTSLEANLKIFEKMKSFTTNQSLNK